MCVRYKYEGIHRRIPKCLTFTPSHRGGWWEALPNSTSVPAEDRHAGGLPLYRLPELLEAIEGNDREIWIVADERCVDAVLALPDTGFSKDGKVPVTCLFGDPGRTHSNASGQDPSRVIHTRSSMPHRCTGRDCNSSGAGTPFVAEPEKSRPGVKPLAEPSQHDLRLTAAPAASHSNMLVASAPQQHERTLARDPTLPMNACRSRC